MRKSLTEAQRAALPHLVDTGPVQFSSGKLTLRDNVENELIMNALR